MVKTPHENINNGLTLKFDNYRSINNLFYIVKGYYIKLELRWKQNIVYAITLLGGYKYIT